MNRNNLIDTIRSFAFILMLYYHLYSLNPKIKYPYPKTIMNIGKISRTTFILLVGVSIEMFKKEENNLFKKYKKPLLILLCAGLISLTSYYVVPSDRFIFFGVLHFIGLVTLLFKSGLKTIYIIPLIILSLYMKNYMYSLKATDNYSQVIFGGYVKTINPLDTFQIFNWLHIVLIGMLIGKALKKINIDIKTNKYLDKFNYIGKHSLELYTIHIIIFMIYYYKFNN